MYVNCLDHFTRRKSCAISFSTNVNEASSLTINFHSQINHLLSHDGRLNESKDRINYHELVGIERNTFQS